MRLAIARSLRGGLYWVLPSWYLDPGFSLFLLAFMISCSPLTTWLLSPCFLDSGSAFMCVVGFMNWEEKHDTISLSLAFDEDLTVEYLGDQSPNLK
jgi:hypothetical protein